MLAELGDLCRREEAECEPLCGTVRMGAGSRRMGIGGARSAVRTWVTNLAQEMGGARPMCGGGPVRTVASGLRFVLLCGGLIAAKGMTLRDVSALRNRFGKSFALPVRAPVT